MGGGIREKDRSREKDLEMGVNQINARISLSLPASCVTLATPSSNIHHICRIIGDQVKTLAGGHGQQALLGTSKERRKKGETEKFLDKERKLAGKYQR